MAEQADAASRADVDPNFERRIRDLRDQATADAAALDQGGQATWHRPGDWEGNVFDREALGDPFDRSQANDQCVAAIRDPRQPGSLGDVQATTTMIDYLGSLQQGFQLRHLSRLRALAHVRGRKLGHASEVGPLVQNVLEPVRTILRRGKEGPIESSTEADE